MSPDHCLTISYMKLNVWWVVVVATNFNVSSRQGFKLKIGFWALVATARRALSTVCFFVPSLGLQNILYHWLAEQNVFSIKRDYKMIHPKDEVHLFNMTGKLM